MAFVLWMTGLPCSGKTTIVRELQKTVPNLAMLDGDELREWLSPKDFTKAAAVAGPHRRHAVRGRRRVGQED